MRAEIERKFLHYTTIEVMSKVFNVELTKNEENVLQDSFVISIPSLRNSLRKEMTEVIEVRDAFNAMKRPERNRLLAEREKDISYAIDTHTDKRRGPKDKGVNSASTQVNATEKQKQQKKKPGLKAKEKEKNGRKDAGKNPEQQEQTGKMVEEKPITSVKDLKDSMQIDRGPTEQQEKKPLNVSYKNLFSSHPLFSFLKQ